MDCCRELDQDKFQTVTWVFTNRHDLVFFLFNTLLNIKCFGDRLCYCENKNNV